MVYIEDRKFQGCIGKIYNFSMWTCYGKTLVQEFPVKARKLTNGIMFRLRTSWESEEQLGSL